MNYVTILRDHGSVRRLVVASRHGSIIQHTRLNATYPDWEVARAEAQRMFPDHTVLIPALGERP